MRLTIGMPAFNEEACIDKAVRSCLQVLDVLPKGEGELFVVDDGSTDQTGPILKRWVGHDQRVRVITHLTNLGITSVSRTLFRQARGDFVFFICSDGEADYGDILKFLKMAEQEGWDAVFGYRKKKRYTPYRHFVSWCFKMLTALFFGVHFRDVGWVRLFRRSLYAPMLVYSDSAFGMAEHALVGLRKGAKQIEVPVEHFPRIAGRGKSASLGRVVASLADLVATRLRWFRFDHYYSRATR